MNQVQRHLPWSREYSKTFHENPAAWRDFDHALKHVVKAAGKLSAMTEGADHGEPDPELSEVIKLTADLVICAMRMANTNPLMVLSAVIDRLEKKNGVKL